MKMNLNLLTNRFAWNYVQGTYYDNACRHVEAYYTNLLDNSFGRQEWREMACDHTLDMLANSRLVLIEEPTPLATDSDKLSDLFR